MSEIETFWYFLLFCVILVITKKIKKFYECISDKIIFDEGTKKKNEKNQDFMTETLMVGKITHNPPFFLIENSFHIYLFSVLRNKLDKNSDIFILFYPKTRMKKQR